MRLLSALSSICYIQAMTCAKLLKITGKVQGVFYRESMRREAIQRGVKGWVRNNSNGAVEAFVQGDEGAVRSLIEWCRQGPPRAEVTQVEEKDAAADASLSSFERKETI